MVQVEKKNYKYTYTHTQNLRMQWAKCKQLVNLVNGYEIFILLLQLFCKLKLYLNKNQNFKKEHAQGESSYLLF